MVVDYVCEFVFDVQQVFVVEVDVLCVVVCIVVFCVVQVGDWQIGYFQESVEVVDVVFGYDCDCVV